MSKSKYSWTIPNIEPEELRELKMEDALDRIKFSKHLFAFVVPHKGTTEILLTGLNKDFFEYILVIILQFPKVMKFFKMVIIAAEALQKSPRKGMTFAEIAGNWVQENFSGILPHDEKKEA